MTINDFYMIVNIWHCENMDLLMSCWLALGKYWFSCDTLLCGDCLLLLSWGEDDELLLGCIIIIDYYYRL